MEGRPTLSDNLLSVRMKHRVGGIALDVDFALNEPWTVLFGPSGSGKTTVLRAIAGFIRPEDERIVKGSEVLSDSSAGVFLPTYRRPVRSAAQTAWLFPHKTVRENLQYGCGSRTKAEDVRDITEEAMSLFRILELADRMPNELSGGEKQRTGVARALVSAMTFDGPDQPLLLLDEPFTGLDAALRDELLLGLKERLGRRKVPVLSVTHSLGEAFQLAAEVIKIADGKILEQGPADVVLARERHRLLEQLGINANG